MTLNNNTNLERAKLNKEDEFYTQLSDIEQELKHYRHHFKDKIVYCNCDDPRVSNFFHYFAYNFSKLGLKKLITTCYKNQQIDLFSKNNEEQAIYLEYTGEKDGGNVPTVENIGVHNLKGDGDFRSPESIELLMQADIVVTNPPFSLFREYISQLIKYNKEFLVIGNINAITYKDIFPFIRDDKMWLGNNHGDMEFMVPDYYEPRKTRFRIDGKGQKWRSMGNICWFTNLDSPKRHENIILYENYDENKHPKYDNYDAIEISRVKEIPMNYDGVMGVPVTFLAQHNPKQFKILGSNRGVNQDMKGIYGRSTYVNGKEKFKRIFIKKQTLIEEGI